MILVRADQAKSLRSVMEFNEEKLVEVVRPYLLRARAGDWSHALRGVKWVKELGIGRDDLFLIITAAYIHDIGWSGVAPTGKIDLGELLKLEPQANQNSDQLINEVLSVLQFSDSEIEIVQRLVKAADRHSSVEEDEEIIVDADSLSKLCLEHLKEKFQLDSFSEVVDMWEKEFPNRIKTSKAKNLFPALLSKLKQDIL